MSTNELKQRYHKMMKWQTSPASEFHPNISKIEIYTTNLHKLICNQKTEVA